MTDALNGRILKVINNGNCSGCGVCSLLSPRVSMQIDENSGYLRPQVATATRSSPSDTAEADEFDKVCPGKSLRAPTQATYHDADFGGYESVWEAWATDPDTRHTGSSAGVLSALSGWLIASGRVTSVTSAEADVVNPSQSTAVRHESAGDMASSAGSRYSPVSTSSAAIPGAGGALVGKPCEIAGVRTLEAERGLDPSFLMSFFCAGTPSQNATAALVSELGFETPEVANLRYRGNGWPGNFEVQTSDGRVGSIPYASAWSRVLGRQIETRCRVCADGTGRFSDLVVADYWDADERGYPKFTEAKGRSAVIARTQRGHEMLRAAAADGVIEITQMEMSQLVGIQPAQTARQRTLVARLAARLLMGKRIPTYRKFSLWRHVPKYPVLSAKHFVGTIIRTRRGK
jgi:coenzyme F420 hydrogenase subunit beta